MNQELRNHDDAETSWEDKILDDENQPELYDPLDVLSVIDYLKTTVTWFIIITVLTVVAGFVTGDHSLFDIIINLFTLVPKAIVEIAILFFSITALTHILRILMEMEFNSRKAD